MLPTSRFLAFFFPFISRPVSLLRVLAVRAVSDPEKKADKSNKNIIDVIKINKEGSSDI